jgi:hypothetical protein
MIRSFVAIDLETLLPETTLGLDLYIQRGTSTFSTVKDASITDGKRQTLLQSGHSLFTSRRYKPRCCSATLKPSA